MRSSRGRVRVPSHPQPHLQQRQTRAVLVQRHALHSPPHLCGRPGGAVAVDSHTKLIEAYRSGDRVAIAEQRCSGSSTTARHDWSPAMPTRASSTMSRAVNCGLSQFRGVALGSQHPAHRANAIPQLNWQSSRLLIGRLWFESIGTAKPPVHRAVFTVQQHDNSSTRRRIGSLGHGSAYVRTYCVDWKDSHDCRTISRPRRRLLLTEHPGDRTSSSSTRHRTSRYRDGPYTIESGAGTYAAEHPGAHFADLLTDFADPGNDEPWTAADHDRFAAAAGALGIGDGAKVVVYTSMPRSGRRVQVAAPLRRLRRRRRLGWWPARLESRRRCGDH